MATNNAPTITNSLTTTPTFLEDSLLNPITQIKINDVLGVDQTTPDILTVTLSVTNGTLNVNTTTGVTITPTGINSITLVGTATDINTALANNFTYNTTKDYNGDDNLVITVSDGIDNTTLVPDSPTPVVDATLTVPISITSINDAPTLASIGLTVAEGGTFTFTGGDSSGGGELGLVDPDIGTKQQVIEQMIVRITALPGQGTLRLGTQILQVGSVFSYDRLDEVIYIHNGTDVSPGDTDSFKVTVNDGGGGVSAETTVNITLNPVNQAPTVGGSGTIFEGEDWNLNITAGLGDKADTLSGATATITISNVKINTLSSGIEGQLYLDVNNDGKFNTGDIDLNSGGSFTVNGSDINSELGKIRFKHSGGETDLTKAPQFNITVKDSGGGEVDKNNNIPVTKETTSTVIINITPVNDDPILTKNDPASITEAQTITLTNTLLQVTDDDLPPNNQLVYTLQSRPSLGIIQLNVGTIGLPDWKTLGIGGFFTQDDIKNNRVKYVQEVGITADTTDTFDFKVRDSAFTIDRTISREGGVRDNPTDLALAVKTFTINITDDPNNTSSVTTPSSSTPGYGGDTKSDPPIDAKVAFTNNNFSNIAIGDRTQEGGNGVLTKDMLNFVFVNSKSSIVPAEQTVYTLLNLPSNGTLQQWNGTTWVNLNVGSTFTQADINQGVLNQANQLNGAIRFLHDDSEDFTSTFDYTVSVGGDVRINTQDSLTDAYDPFIIDIIPRNDDPDINQAKSITLQEGATKTILPAEVELSDVDGVGSDKPNDPIVLLPSQAFKANTDIINFKVTTLPINGVLFIDENGNNKNDAGDTVIDADTLISKNDLNNGKVKFDYNSGFNTNTFTPTLNVTPYDANNQSLTPLDIDFSPEKFAFTNILQFQVTDLPDYGTLFIDGNSNNKFDFTDNNSNGVFDTGDASTEAVILNTWYDQSFLSSDKLLYTHEGTENFLDTFKLQGKDNHGFLTDSDGNPDNGDQSTTVKIDIFPVNDKPLVPLTPNDATDPDPTVILPNGGTDTGKNDPLTVNEGATGTIDNTLLKAVDPDNSTTQRQFSVTDNVDNGTLLLNNKPLGVGSTFTQADIDNNRLIYKHNGLEVFTDRFYFQVSDGDKTTDVAYFDIIINPLNDKPTLTTKNTIFNLGSTSPLNITGVSVADVDLVNVAVGEIDQIRVTIDPRLSGVTYSEGILNLVDTDGITIIQGTNNTSGNKLVFEGTLTDINTALASLTYQVTTDLNQTIELNVTVDDRLRDGSGNVISANGGLLNQGTNGSTLTLSDTDNTVSSVIKINVSTTNNFPIVEVPSPLTVNEDTSLSITGIDVTDADTFNSNINTVTLSITKGTLTLGDKSLITGGANGSNTITLTGSFSDIDMALNGLSYKGNLDFNGSDTLTIIATDPGSVGDDGTKTTTQTVAITVVPVNDTPTLAVPGTQTINTNNPLIVTGISIDDSADISPNTGKDNFTVTLTATRTDNNNAFGNLTVVSGSGASITNDGTSTVTISGTKAQVNTALNGLSFDPGSGNYNIDAPINLAVSVNDNANGGTAISGVGDALTVNKNVIINISDKNNAPSFVNLDASPTYKENGTAIVLDGNATIIDPELSGLFNNWNGASLTLQRQGGANTKDIFGRTGTLNLSSGNIKLNEGGNNISIGTFTNTGGTLTFKFNNSATTDRVNTALKQITYKNTSDDLSLSGPVTIAYTINDGNTGLQGNSTPLALTGNGSVTVNFTPQPDRPVLSPSTGSATFNEAVGVIGDNKAISVDATIVLTDVDDTEMASANISIGGFKAGDVLAVNTVGTINASYDTGTGILKLSGTDSIANYQQVLQSLTFVNTGDDPLNTPRTITYSITDANSDGAGAATSVNVTRTITVVPVNDAPTLTAIGTTTTYIEDAPISSLFSGSIADTIEANQLITKLVFTVSNVTDIGNEQISINGTTLTLTDGATFTNGGFSGTVSLINGNATVTINNLTDASEADIQNLVNSLGYKNTSQAPTEGDRTVTITSITDNGGVLNSGLETSNLNLISTVNVIAVNDAPVLNEGVDPVLSSQEDNLSPVGAVGSLISNFVGGISDVDGVNAPNGIALTKVDFASLGTLWYSTNNGSKWTAITSGSLSETNALLLANNTDTRIYFQPTLNLNGNLTTGITFRAWDQTSDQGNNGQPWNIENNSRTEDGITNIGSGGITGFSANTDTITINISPVNDAPLRRADIPNPVIRVDEDSTNIDELTNTVASLFDPNFNDDIDNQTTNGGSSANVLAGIVIISNNATPDQGKWQWYNNNTWETIDTGNISANALFLDKDTPIRFLPALNYNGNPGVLRVRLVDSSVDPDLKSGNTFPSTVSNSGGTTAFSDNANTVNLRSIVKAINDTPTLSTPSQTQTLGSGDNITFSTSNAIPNGISIDDFADLSNNGFDNFTVTLKVTNIANGASYGTLTLATKANLTVNGDGTNTVTLTGTKGNINTALEGLIYNPPTSNLGINEDVTAKINVLVDDLGNGSSPLGTNPLTVHNDVLINISSTNDAPVISNPLSIIAFEDTPFNFNNGNSISFNDPDDFGSELEVTLSVTKGQLSLGTFTDNQTLTFRGTESALNEALESLIYKGNKNYNTLDNNKDVLSITINDLSNTGSGGANIVTRTIDISVTPVNDAPIALPATLAAVNEDTVNPPGATVGVLFPNIINSPTLGKFDDRADRVTGGSIPNTLAGLAITGNSADEVNEGKWQYFFNNAWRDVPTSVDVITTDDLSDSNAITLTPATKIRFLPVADFSGTPTPLTVRLIDNNAGLDANGNFTGFNPINGATEVNVSNNEGVTAISNAVELGTIINPINDPPIINELDGDYSSILPNSSASVIDQSTLANITDIEGLNSTGLSTTSVLTVSLQGIGVGTGDTLSFLNGNGVNISGSNISIDDNGTPVTIGIFTGGQDGNPLQITFNSNITNNLATTLIQNITYQQTNGIQGIRAVSFTVTDGDGGTSNTATAYINTSNNIYNVPLQGDSTGQARSDIIKGSDDSLRGDIINGKGANDILYGYGGNDFMLGGDGNDTAEAGVGNDIVFGGNGADLLNGSDGNDFLFGEDGIDRLNGGMGKDYLNGGLGRDTLTGNQDQDFFDYRNPADSLLGITTTQPMYDLITDFNVNEGDKILTNQAITGLIKFSTNSLVISGTTLTENGIKTALNGATFGKNSTLNTNTAALLRLGTTTRYFLAIDNDGNGFNHLNDSLIEISTTGSTIPVTHANFNAGIFASSM